MNKNTKRARKSGLSCQPTRLEGKNAYPNSGCREISRDARPLFWGSECETNRQKLGKIPKRFAVR